MPDGLEFTRDYPAISYSSQPYLRMMFDSLCTEDALPITIIAGAGVSCDAGLPNWNELVDHICKLLVPDLVDNFREDQSDPIRKIDYAFRARMPAPNTRPESEIVRDALYEEMGNAAVPGRLADVVARFTREARGTVRIATTNFDVLVENALKLYYRNVNSHAISNLGRWIQMTNRRHSASVLHLHGVIAPSVDPVGPLMLKEGAYEANGKAVRETVGQMLQMGHVIFIGVSLTDPNIVAPLRDTASERADSDKHCFQFMVVDSAETRHHVADEVRDAEVRADEFLKIKCDYLVSELSVKPIVCKSFSQIQQVMSELTVASQDYQRYNDDDPITSRRYGYRFTRALNYAYEAVGAPKGSSCDWWPSGESSERLCERLSQALRMPDPVTGAAGPEAYLRELAEAIPAIELDSLGLTHPYLRSEGFSIFLWLRQRPDNGRPQGEASYSLRMMGTSGYSYKDKFTNDRTVIMGRPTSSNYLAAFSVYFGRAAQSLALPDERALPLWRSMIASPLTWTNEENDNDELVLGAVTLNSNRRGWKKEILRERKRAGTFDLDRLRPSILGLIRTDQAEELTRRLGDAALRVIRREEPTEVSSLAGDQGVSGER